MEKITQILTSFSPISLQEMDAVQLLNRTDTKFVFNISVLEEILPALTDYYCALEISDKRIAQYKTLYFDTQKFDFYLHHHNEWPDRYKVRIRKYVDSDLCFLEIKHKKKGRTIKSRIRIEGFEETLSDESIKFINDVIPGNVSLQNVLWNSFHRITLVNKVDTERLTLDIGLNFDKDGNSQNFSNIIIGEVKQERVDRHSPFMEILKNKGIRPLKISKYCTGAKLLYPELKNNRFKAKHIYLNKINS